MHVGVPEGGQGGGYAVQFILKSRAFPLELADYRLHQCFWHEAILSLATRQFLRTVRSTAQISPFHQQPDCWCNPITTIAQRQRRSSFRRCPPADLLLLDFSLIPILERTRLRRPAQLFKPLSHFPPARFASITVFTVWAVDSQEGQQVADPTSQVHNPPRP